MGVNLKRIKPVFNQYAGADQRLDRLETATASQDLLQNSDKKMRNLGRNLAAIALDGSNDNMLFPDKNGDGIDWKEMKKLAARRDNKRKLGQNDIPKRMRLGKLTNDAVSQRLDDRIQSLTRNDFPPPTDCRFPPRRDCQFPPMLDCPTYNFMPPAWDNNCFQNDFMPRQSCDDGLNQQCFQTYGMMTTLIQQLFTFGGGRF